MKVIIDNHKEIQEVKNVLNEHFEQTIKMANEDFKDKRVDILKQIDTYLNGIQEELKGTKPFQSKYAWQFSCKGESIENNDYPSNIMVKFDDGGIISFTISLWGRYSSETLYGFTIKDGKFITSNPQKWLNENISLYEDVLIKYWKTLKKAINDGILYDFQKAQNYMNDKLNKAQSKKEMLDNFEI